MDDTTIASVNCVIDPADELRVTYEGEDSHAPRSPEIGFELRRLTTPYTDPIFVPLPEAYEFATKLAAYCLANMKEQA